MIAHINYNCENLQIYGAPLKIATNMSFVTKTEGVSAKVLFGLFK